MPAMIGMVIASCSRVAPQKTAVSGRSSDGGGADGGGLQRMADQVRSEQDAGSQEADRHAEIVESARPLGGCDPGGEDGGPQGRSRVEDARQSAADRQLAEADAEP